MKYMLLNYWYFDFRLMGQVYKERLVHHYFFNSIMRSGKGFNIETNVKINIVYSRILFLSYFFLDKTLVVLLDQENPNLLLKELVEVAPENYDLCMEIVVRVFESLEKLGCFVTFVISGFVYDCLTLNNNGLLNDSVYSIKEFSVANYLALSFGRYNTLVWLDDLSYLMVNKSLDEFRFRKHKEQLSNWYMMCKYNKIDRRMLFEVDTFLSFFKDLTLFYMMEHKDIDLLLFFIEKDLKRKEWVIEGYYNNMSKRNSYRYLWVRNLMLYELNESKAGSRSLVFEKQCYKYRNVRY